MRKLKYASLLAVISCVVFFAGCLKDQGQITGPTGATGSKGAPGGDFFAPHTLVTLNSSSFSATAVPNTYSYKWVLSSYNPNKYSYMLTVYAAKLNGGGQTPIWNKLPYPDVYQPPPSGDVLFAAMKSDTVIISYFSPSGLYPSDSGSMNCAIILVQYPL